MDVQHGIHNKEPAIIQRLNLRSNRFGHRGLTIKTSLVTKPKHRQDKIGNLAPNR
jgi:hypothetical protein